jgi:uncharacterized membrane protein YeaQ/YmgE (transglycosylase-associated protein family)
MQKLVAAIKSILAFGFVGAVLGALTSYVLEYWGGHISLFQAVLDNQARPIALRHIGSNLLFTFAFALPASLLAGVFLSLFALLVTRRSIKFNIISWLITGASAGALSAFILYGSQDSLGWPLSSALLSGALAACLLARRLEAWLCAELPSSGVAGFGVKT